MKKNVLLNKLNSCKKPMLALLFTMLICLGAFAQNGQITGKVTSADDGQGMPGVSVRVKGTSTGTITDANGVYKIPASNGAVLTFNFIGYVAQNVTVGSDNTVNVKLAPSAINLTEVAVVDIGYGTSKKKDLSGSISSVSGATLEKLPASSLDQALQGRAAGVQVTNNDGAPGGNMTVLIRGTGSLASGANGPLYIIDGFPVTGGINGYNNDDIASIDILKDASATAIYGIRAANGVVLVTTKKGKKNSSVVSVDAYNAFQSTPKMYKVLNAQQFATLANSVASQPSQNFTSNPAWADPASLH
ncbi:MAG: TonB-dependent receptor plug domain-containing protein, partial [Mucilaginibacter sp.]